MSLTSSLKNLLLILVTSLITLTFIEVVLRIVNIPPQELSPDVIHDSILVNSMPVDYPEIDSRGFRNGKDVPISQTEIITLGDSHTYGYNVPMRDSWPSLFAAQVGRSVYNMGIGGYGSLQYYYLVDSALQRRPKHIMLGMYLANDLKDICYAYRIASYWKEHAPADGLDLSYCDAVFIKDEQARLDRAKTASPKPINWIKESRMWSLWMRAKPFLMRTFHRRSLDQYIVVDDEKNPTLIGRYVIKEHAGNMDVDDPEIASSLAVTKILIERMAERSRQAGTKLVVLLVPSKEYVFYDYLRARQKELPDYYQQAVHNENALKSQLSDFFQSRNIPVIDAAPFVIRALNTEGGVYTRDADGHPLAAGYRAYAQAMYEGYWRNATSY